MSTSAYISDETLEFLRQYQKEHDLESLSGAVNEILKKYQKIQREERLREKYRREEPVSDEVISSQSDALTDLDE